MRQIVNLGVTDLETIKGGTSTPIITGIIVAAIVTFISGIIEGISNPRGCSG